MSTYNMHDQEFRDGSIAKRVNWEGRFSLSHLFHCGLSARFSYIDIHQGKGTLSCSKKVIQLPLLFSPLVPNKNTNRALGPTNQSITYNKEAEEEKQTR